MCVQNFIVYHMASSICQIDKGEQNFGKPICQMADFVRT